MSRDQGPIAYYRDLFYRESQPKHAGKGKIFLEFQLILLCFILRLGSEMQYRYGGGGGHFCLFRCCNIHQDLQKVPKHVNGQQLGYRIVNSK